MRQTTVADSKAAEQNAYIEKEGYDIAADPLIKYMTDDQIKMAVSKLEKQMEEVVMELDFIEAARLRDEIFALKKKLGEI